MGPGVGGGAGVVVGGSVGLGFGCSAKGGRPGLDDSAIGLIVASSPGGRVSGIGEGGDGGLSVSSA